MSVTSFMMPSAFSPRCVAMPNKEAATVAKAFHDHVIIGGPCVCPAYMHSDRGSEFLASLFQELLKQYQIRHFKSTPIHPTAQANNERMHRTIGGILKTMLHKYGKDFEEALPYAVYCINNGALHRHRVGIEAVVVVVVASMWGIALLSSRKRAWVRACICGCMRQIYKYSDAFSSACSTTSVVIAGGWALGRRTTYSHAHTRPASLPNEHLGGRCRAAAGGVGGVRKMIF